MSVDAVTTSTSIYMLSSQQQENDAYPQILHKVKLQRYVVPNPNSLHVDTKPDNSHINYFSICKSLIFSDPHGKNAHVLNLCAIFCTDTPSLRSTTRWLMPRTLSSPCHCSRPTTCSGSRKNRSFPGICIVNKTLLICRFLNKELSLWLGAGEVRVGHVWQRGACLATHAWEPLLECSNSTSCLTTWLMMFVCFSQSAVHVKLGHVWPCDSCLTAPLVKMYQNQDMFDHAL